MMKFRNKLIILFLVMGICIVVDQATKKIAEKHLKHIDTISFAGDTFRLQYAENSGAFLSLGNKFPPKLRFIIFTLGVCVMLAGLFLYLLFSKKLDSPTYFTLSLIFSGGISNLIDRIFRDGYVIDFLNMGIGPLRTGIFNFADVFITSGAAMLIFLQYKLSKNKPITSKAEQIVTLPQSEDSKKS